MQYVSTRGSAPTLGFEEVTLAGLASDGGLYLPEEWPRLSHDDIASLRGLPYSELATRVMEPFVGDALSPGQLLALCDAAYASFAHKAVTPLAQLNEQHWLLELFHGPTLAFKDVALQLLGQLFETFLTRRQTHLTIIGATSGDTGSAAINAVAGREHIDIVMLHPKGRISDVQRCQMTTVAAPNVHNVAIEGSFDEAQDYVKRMFTDPDLSADVNLGAVNSINWARLMAQVVYYFAAALQLGAPERKVAFSVPTGNFGDVFAGYVASRMGLPIERLIVATNVNDILHRALSTGDYSVGQVHATTSPSMDIQVSSNFERLLFDLGERDGAAMREQMTGFGKTKRLALSQLQADGARDLFTSVRADEAEMARALRWAYDNAGQIIDPHTAIGLHAAREQELPRDVPIVTLATAHPAKFRDTVERATGFRPSLPARVGDLFSRNERYDVLPSDYDTLVRYVRDKAAG